MKIFTKNRIITVKKYTNNTYSVLADNNPVFVFDKDANFYHTNEDTFNDKTKLDLTTDDEKIIKSFTDKEASVVAKLINDEIGNKVHYDMFRIKTLKESLINLYYN